MAGFLARGSLGTLVLLPQYRPGLDITRAYVLDFVMTQKEAHRSWMEEAGGRTLYREKVENKGKEEASILPLLKEPLFRLTKGQMTLCRYIPTNE